jgi:hypothetical protein
MNPFQMIQQLKQNPMGMLSKRFNIPQNVNLQDPNAIIQHLMNTGQVSQDAYNWANQQAKQMQKNNNMM